MASKATKRSRAEEAGIKHIGGKEVPTNSIQIKCQYPPCNTMVTVPDPKTVTPDKQKPPFCDKHMEWIAFIMWIMPRIQIKQQETPHGIILPGNKDFKAEFQGGPPVKE